MFFYWDSIDFRLRSSGFAASTSGRGRLRLGGVPTHGMDHGHQEKGRRMIGPVELKAIPRPPRARGRGRACDPGPDSMGQDRSHGAQHVGVRLPDRGSNLVLREHPGLVVLLAEQQLEAQDDEVGDPAGEV